MLKSVTSILIASSLFLSPIAQAEQVTKTNDEFCLEALAAADAAIAGLGVQISAQQELIDTVKKQLDTANQINLELIERQNAWYRDPQTIGTAGLIAGVILGAWITKGR